MPTVEKLPHRFTVFLALLLWATTAAAIPDSLPIRREFTAAVVDNEPTIWRFANTPQGQLLFCGQRLGFYEHHEWKFVAGLRKVAIRDLLIDGDTLWLASAGEIGRMQLPLTVNSVYQPLRTSALADAGEIWQLRKSAGWLVAVATNSIILVAKDGSKAIATPLQTKSRLLALDWPDRVLILQPARALWEVRDGSLVPYANPLPDPTELMWHGSDGTYVLTSRALFRRHGPGWTQVASFQDAFRSEIFASVTRWGDHVAAATVNRGLLLFDLRTGRWQAARDSTGAGTEYATIAYVDPIDRLWVASRKGITLFESTRFGHTLLFPEPPQFAIRHEGLFVGYDNHASYFHDSGRERTFGERVWTFHPTKSGPAFGLWGKVIIGDKTITTFGNSVTSLAGLPDGRLVASSGERIFAIEPTAGTADLVATPNTPLTGLVVAAGKLWAAGSNGRLYRSEIGAKFGFQAIAQFPQNGESEAETVDELPVFTAPEGAFFGAELQLVHGTNGLRNGHLARNDDGVWLVGVVEGKNRLGRLVRQGASVVWQTVEAKGLSQILQLRSISGSKHTLTLCGDSTILELKSDQLASAYRLDPPTLTFRYQLAHAEGTTTATTPPPQLTSSANSLAFSGTIPFDEFGEQPRFERRLLPTETAWVSTTLGEVVGYPSLAPRDYTLEVRATHLGRVGQVARHHFTVLPPWYATRLAVAGYLVFAAIGFYGLYHLRTHQLRRRTAELESLVKERTQALKEASEAKTEFLASMSHEIRNPMNGVIGLVEMLGEEPTTPRQTQTLRLLQHCADQLRGTVDDILDFSRIEAGRLDLESTTFDLRDALDAAAATIDLSGSKITYIDRPEPGVMLIGDAGKLRRIFANYLSNALKYGVPPGARVSTLLTPTDGGVRLTLGVASSGPTIPKDTLDKFFDSFSRGRDAIERNIHGNGLGLAICRRCAQAMGGEVGAVSANGETTFYLNLPFARAAGTAAPAPAVVRPGPLPARALAIEDEDYNRIVLGNILAKMNYTVTWATTGAQALQLARENGYDIILTDYRLPDTNGVELTRKILEFSADPKPAVFAVTAYSTKERRDECLNAGMSGFISKPITLEKLRSTLAGWGEQNLAKISFETSRLPQPALLSHLPAEVTETWRQLQAMVREDPKQAAGLAHRLNNLCRAHHLIDAAEQLELLEGALERGEPADVFLQACGEFLHS